MSKIHRAILSVTDKSGLPDFARQLAKLGVELVSTGGTAKLLRDSGIAVKDISELTGFPEMLDGRVKTLHPKVHGGILHRRDDAAHRVAVAEHGILPIDMVVVNLYAFEKTAAKPDVPLDELIENIDIGGPSMIRSAAKNFHDVAIVTSPSDYAAIAEEMTNSGGALSAETKLAPCEKSLRHHRRLRFRHRLYPRTDRLQRHANLRAASLRLCACLSRKRSTCATARIRTRKPPCTPTARMPESPTPASYRARSFPTTTSSTCRRPGTSRQEFEEPVCRHHQAHQSLRRRHRQDTCRSLQESAGMRSGFRFRRRDRSESPRRRSSCRRDAQALRGSHRRARLRSPLPKKNSPPRKICAWSKSSLPPRSGC